MPVIIIKPAARAMPHRPQLPKATKYCMASWPEAKPAPTTTPINAMEIPIARFNMKGRNSLTHTRRARHWYRAGPDRRSIYHVCSYLINHRFP